MKHTPKFQASGIDRAISRSLNSVFRICRFALPSLGLALIVTLPQTSSGQDTKGTADNASFQRLGKQYSEVVQGILKRTCNDCHSTSKMEGDLDLEQYRSLTEIRRAPKAWIKVIEMLDNGEMPPKDAPQLSNDEKKLLRDWARNYLDAEALANAGDPGPVVLRRLSNSEYNYTIRDLTGIPSLNPTREFPVDSAAGEGFTNTGNALVMSPALLTKYFDAAKEISQHAVLLPTGIEFSPNQTSSDWTNEKLAAIREFYRKFADEGGGTQVNLQGIVFDTNSGGRLAVEKYLKATLVERDSLKSGQKSIAQVAAEQKLNPKYLGMLWEMLQQKEQSIVLSSIRSKWEQATPEKMDDLLLEVSRWQQALWRFTSVGHIGKKNGPTSWQEKVSPVATTQEIRVKLNPQLGQKETVLYLAASDLADGNANDFVVWNRPRIVAPGRPELSLRDLRSLTQALASKRTEIFSATSKILDAVSEASSLPDPSATELAKKYQVDETVLSAWLDMLGIGGSTELNLSYLTDKQSNGGGYDFVKGWSTGELPNITANSSDQHVRIPGNLKGHGVCVHPTPEQAVCIGWQSPIDGAINIEGAITHAHPECGNGTTWEIVLRRGSTRQLLANGVAHGGTPVPFGPLSKIAIRKGDLISVVIGPRDGNHSCDLTDVDLKLSDVGNEKNRWSLSGDVSADIHAANPHSDSLGNPNVWHFYREPVQADGKSTSIPAGSLLARWQTSTDKEEKRQIGAALQQLLLAGPEVEMGADHPDVRLYKLVGSLAGPLMQKLAARLDLSSAANSGDASSAGLDPQLFGKHPKGQKIDDLSICVAAPNVIEVRIPNEIAEGAEFVTTAMLDPESAKEGSAQALVLDQKPDLNLGVVAGSTKDVIGTGPWTSNNRSVSHSNPILVHEGSQARARIEKDLEQFRDNFPIALCYTKIVPVDEVVTLTLFFREDDQLQRLMLSPEQTAELNRLWDELHYVSRDALTLVDAYNQLMEYATQDADPSVFEPLRKPINDRAAAFRETLLQSEPAHIQAVLEFANRAFRRPLTSEDRLELENLYVVLRKQELPHEEAIRLLIAKVLVSPAFLYRTETPPDSEKSGPVNDFELATRLSYFLWASQPDASLREAAQAGSLRKDEVVSAEAKRMLADPRAVRLATEFAAQWLHIYDFENLNEKSERHFPEFLGVRSAMAKESELFFADLFQNDRSILSLIDSDYTFLNEQLANYYGIPGVAGEEWRRVDNIKQFHRGGILTLGTTLTKQAGASRTSAILRGNWLCEVVLGDKLPKPPQGVPQLPDSVPEGLTERQLIERHSTEPSCIKCHAQIDPFGYALEGFDAVGRFREKDVAGLKIDTLTSLPDGSKIDGLEGLRSYILEKRKEDFVRQFCKKLLGFSLGRATQLSDEPLLQEMQTKLAANDYRVSVAVESIIQSQQFREIRGSRSTIQDE